MKKGTVFTTIILMMSNVIVKILGLGRDVTLANTYGTSIYSDAYIVANNIPIVIFSVVAVAISTSFIPVYSEINEHYGKEKALYFMNNFINIILVISIIITLLGELFPNLLVKIFAYGFNEEAYILTVNFTKILMPAIIVIALMGIFGSYLQLNEDFIPISYVSIPNNIIVMLSIIISFYSNKPIFLVIGTLVGMISQIIYYIPFLKRNGYRYNLFIDLKDKYLYKIFIMVVPVFIGAAVNEVNVIIDKTLVSGMQQGSIASLNYASKLIGFITGVFIVSILTIVYPKMSEMSAKLKIKELNIYTKKILSIISLIIIPITIITIFYSRDIVMIIFQRGTFNEESTYMTAIALSSYAIGLIGIGYREVLTKVYFSLKDTKTPMINGAVAVILNIILNIILIKQIGFVGSAISTSIISIIVSILLLNKLKRKIGKIIEFNFYINILKIVFASVISSYICNTAYKNLIRFSSLKIYNLLILMFASILTLIVYILILLIVKENNIYNAIEYVKEKLKRKDVKNAS